MFALAKSLIKENKGLTFALVALYMLTVALVVVVAVVPSTVRSSVASFFKDCNTADCYIYTPASGGGSIETIKEIEGVTNAVVRETCECNVRLPDGKLCLMNFVSVPNDSFMLMWRYDKDDVGVCSANSGTGLGVSKRYTLFSNLSVGDTVEVLSPLGNKKVEVSDVVASAESIIAMHDLFSWYEDESFGIFYVSEEMYHDLFGTENGVNNWLLEIDPSYDCEEVAQAAYLTLGEQQWSQITLRTDSIPYHTINGNLETLDSVCTYLPTLMLVIALGFSVLFISQVVLRSRSFIGLLKALGYSDARIAGVFQLYVLAPTFGGMVLGSIAGMICSRVLVSLYVEQFTLPSILLSCDGVLVALQLLGIVALAAVACLLASFLIGRVDPAEAYGGLTEGGSKKPPLLARILPVGPFAKIAISLSLHNKVRIVNCAVCIMCALCLVMSSVMLYVSMSTSMQFTFEERLQYDSLVDVTETQDGTAAIENLDEVVCAETVLRGYVQASTCTENEEHIQVNGIAQDAELIALYDAQGERIAIPDTGIVIDEGLAHRLDVSEGDMINVGDAELQVAAIAREYVNPISYVSFDQMEQLKITSSVATVVTFAEGVSQNDFREAVYEAAPNAYVLFLESQQKNMEAAMSAINIPIVFIVVLSVLIGLIIVYNMTELSIAERRREYATLLVLGVGNARIAGITLAESIGELLLALLVGCPIAFALSGFVLEGMCSVNIQYPIVYPEASMAASCLITTVYVIFATLLTQVRVHQWNPLVILNAGD